jgi:IS5 family transposase
VSRVWVLVLGESVMRSDQISFTDVEYANRRRVSRREEFLLMMDAAIPWARWVGLIEPFYYSGKRGRKPKALETMLRMYLLQAWFSLSDEGAEDAIYDSYAMRRFMGLDFTVEQVPDATTLLHFRHLLEKHELGKKLLESQGEIFAEQGWIMHGGSIVDATIISAPSSTKNADGARDPEMHQTKKGNQWHFGMKAHIGVDAGTGYVHAVTATAANVHDLDEIAKLLRVDDEVVYADAGYQGVQKRPEVAGDPHLSQVEFRIAARKSRLATMAGPDRAAESRKASVRAKVEHPFLIVKRDFGFTKTRYRGLAKNRNHLHVLFASANWLMRARAVALMG